MRRRGVLGSKTDENIRPTRQCRSTTSSGKAVAAKLGYAKNGISHARNQVALAAAVAAVGIAGAKLVAPSVRNRAVCVLAR